MKKKIILSVFILLSYFNYSQSNLSKIVYKRSVYNNNDVQSKNQDVNKIGKFVDDIISKIEYELLFNETESIYQVVNNLELKESPVYRLAVGSDKIFYRNIKSKEFIKNVETLGSPINVEMKYNKYDWEITKETKKIGKFTCFKAVAIFKEHNPLRKVENTFTPVVWFTMDIPLPFGPEGLDGLPGLVLEATLNGQTYFYASKLELNKYNNSDFKIQKPKGEVISEDRYMKILEDRLN